MADIQFQEERGYQTIRSDEPSFLTRLVLSTGFVRTERAAQYVLLSVAILIVVLTLVLRTVNSEEKRIPVRATHISLSY